MVLIWFIRKGVKMDKKTLLIEITGWYHYDGIAFNDDGSISISNGLDTLEYASIDAALKGWMGTLEESNYDCDQCEEPHIWTDAEIEFVKSL